MSSAEDRAQSDTGESNLIDAHVVRNGIAKAAVTIEDVDHARREASLTDELA